jgi:ferredoxin-NADP reductase
MTADASRPAAPTRSTLSARVERIFDHASDTRSLFLSQTNGKSLRFVPGQFISVSIPLGDETRSRPYTIASSPIDSGPFEICFNRVPGGRGVRWLFERRVGDTLDFAGPFGTFTIDADPAPEVELGFIAEGTAIAPIRPMLKRALAGSGRVAGLSAGLAVGLAKMHLIYAARDREHILYSSELDEFARTAPNFSYETVITSPEKTYDRLLELINARWILADSYRTRQFYICGVGNGVIQLRDLLRGSGYERRAVHYERW